SAPKPKLLRWVHPGELASAASAVVLIAVMFALEWYGLDKPPGKASGAERATAENGWHALAVLRWVTLFVAFLALAAVLLHITQRAHGASSDTAGVLTLIGAGLALALTYRVLIDLPDPSSVVDQKLGAYL